MSSVDVMWPAFVGVCDVCDVNAKSDGVFEGVFVGILDSMLVSSTVAIKFAIVQKKVFIL